MCLCTTNLKELLVQGWEAAANIRVIHNAVLKKAAPIWILNKHTLLYCKHYIVIQVASNSTQ